MSLSGLCMKTHKQAHILRYTDNTAVHTTSKWLPWQHVSIPQGKLYRITNINTNTNTLPKQNTHEGPFALISQERTFYERFRAKRFVSCTFRQENYGKESCFVFISLDHASYSVVTELHHSMIRANLLPLPSSTVNYCFIILYSL